jgi:hypothetical protein
VSMTGNAAQVFLTDEEWAVTLRAAHAALRPSGRLAFEIRDPARQAWRGWTRQKSDRRLEIAGVGAVRTWFELTDVRLPLVSFRPTFVSRPTLAGHVRQHRRTGRRPERCLT